MAVMQGMRLAPAGKRREQAARPGEPGDVCPGCGLWPGFDAAEVPITSVTNGVHVATWVAPEILSGAADGAAGHGDPAEEPAWDRGRQHQPGPDMGQIRRTLRGRLIAEARRRLRGSWRQRGVSESELGWIRGRLWTSTC